MPKPPMDIKRFTPEERLALVESLRDSLSEDDVRLTDAQRAELDRRLDALDREGPVGIPWEQLYKELADSMSRICDDVSATSDKFARQAARHVLKKTEW